jgi:hypothetical protein
MAAMAMVERILNVGGKKLELDKVEEVVVGRALVIR